MKRSTILLLDEATASVDYESDARIQETIRKEFKACTVLTVAHRLNTIVDSDMILVLDKGQVKEFGTPSALLMDTESLFYSMVEVLGPEQFAAFCAIAKSNSS